MPRRGPRNVAAAGFESGRERSHFDALFVSQRAADQLVDRQALVAEAEHLGFKATPEEVKDELQHGQYAQVFFPGGTFIGQAEYQELLQQHNLTPVMFEEDVRKGILISKLQALITGGAFVSDAAVRQQFDKENTKIKFEYAGSNRKHQERPPSDHGGAKGVLRQPSEELREFDPEKRKVKYAALDLSKIQAGIQISRSELQAYYDQHRDQYRVAEQVKVSHILIKTPLPGPDGKVDEKGVAAAQARAADLLKQIRSGANFEELAKKYSEDPGSAKEGGSLGWIPRGRTVPEFEKVAFSLAEGADQRPGQDQLWLSHYSRG